MGQEKRKQKRVVLRREVVINNSLRVMGLDLSEGGLYVHTGRSFLPGSTVNVSIPLAGITVNTKARIQHTQDGVGMGLMFLSLTEMQSKAVRKYIEESLEVDPEKVSKKKVLIIDENPTSRRMNKSKLVLDGFTVIEAQNGMEGVDILRKEHINLVVLDLYMEKLNGFKILSMMRTDDRWKEIPALVLSSRSAPDDIDKAMEAGATEFLVKITTSPAKLSDRIKQHLSSK